MSYTLQEWEDVSKNMDRFSLFDMPVETEALKKAVPGSKSFCTIALATSMFTGMDPVANQIEVTAQHIKYVIGGKRYFLFHEVIGAEHIKNLDELAFHENGEAKVEDFQPFTLKLRYYDDKEIHLRPRVARPKIVSSSEPVISEPAPKKVQQTHEVKASAEGAISPTAVTSPRRRRQRSDAGKKKSRWSR